MDELACASLQLGQREGLPDCVAYLRTDFPRGAWRRHPNFGELAGFWLHVHASLRREGSELTNAVDAFRHGHVDGAHFQAAFVPLLNGFLGHLDLHHRVEDGAYFPKFRQLDERLVLGFDLLEADHKSIHERLLATVEHARELLSVLSSQPNDAGSAADRFAGKAEDLIQLLLQHLADEEDLVIPAILEHGERPLL